MGDDDVLGLIDDLAVEWPGAQVTGQGFQLLLDLVERGAGSAGGGGRHWLLTKRALGSRAPGATS